MVVVEACSMKTLLLESVCCLLVLDSVTSTPQWIRQPEAAWYEAPCAGYEMPSDGYENEIRLRPIPPKISEADNPNFSTRELQTLGGFWATPNGNMAVTKQRVLVKAKDVLELLTHHPLETKIAKELFQSMAVV